MYAFTKAAIAHFHRASMSLVEPLYGRNFIISHKKILCAFTRAATGPFNFGASGFTPLHSRDWVDIVHQYVRFVCFEFLLLIIIGFIFNNNTNDVFIV